MDTDTPTVEQSLTTALELLLTAYQLKSIRDGKGCDLINAAVNETTLALRKERKHLQHKSSKLWLDNWEKDMRPVAELLTRAEQDEKYPS